jgi:hypothetical protein
MKRTCNNNVRMRGIQKKRKKLRRAWASHSRKQGPINRYEARPKLTPIPQPATRNATRHVQYFDPPVSAIIAIVVLFIAFAIALVVK